MIKLCLIGNSHTAALKRGWEIIKSEFPNCDLTVFAAPGTHLDQLQVRGRRLVPDTVKLRRFLRRISGVTGRIEVGDYDRFLVCGSYFSASVLARFLVKARLDTEPSDVRQPLSSPFFMRVVEADLRASSAILTAEKLRQITDKPIGLIPMPLLVDWGKWVAGKAILGTETPQKLADCFAAAARMIANSLNCEIFCQPEFTKSGPLHTKGEYLKGSTRLRSNHLHGSENISHMNAEYGVVVWRAILANPAWSGEKAPDAVCNASAFDPEPDASLTPALSSCTRASFESSALEREPLRLN